MNTTVSSRAGSRRARVAAGCAGALVAMALQTAPARAGLVEDLLRPVTALDTTPGLLTGAPWAYAPSATTLADVAAAIGADKLHRSGYTGRGVGVALIDTGVVPVRGLTSGNVVQGPDLALGRQPATLGYDSFGHGTHMAGIIAGRDATDGSGWRGIAPDATLLNLRVGSFDGAVDVSQVVAAIDWVVQHRNDRGLAIKVLAMAYGTNSTQDYRSDPLTHAVENAWRAGITVVVAGGNKGSVQASLDSPAVDPYVLAVGATDTHGTTQGVAQSLDDTVPSFSSRGSASRHVDIVAPGQSIVSLRDPGAILDSAYPLARVDARWFKGSGTSQAAAVVAGAAALLLQARPTLTPDQVKAAFVTTAAPLLTADAAGRGAGAIDAAGAAAAALPALLAQTWPRSSGRGSLELARGSAHVGDGHVTLAGESDVLGRSWVPATWAAASSAGTAWSGGTWNGGTWAGTCWCASSWAGTSWQSAGWPRVWSGVDPAGRGWSGQSWSGQSWSGQSWSGQSWSGQSWSGQSWSGQSWSGQAWPGSSDGG